MMIVPYNMIPVQYFKPLNVETKMEYTINKKKFPGLSIKSERLLPSLMIATEAKPLSQDDLNSPIDLSKPRTAQKNDPRNRTRRDIVTRTKSRRLQLETENKCTQFQVDGSRIAAGMETLDTLKSPKVSGSNQSLSTHLTPSRLFSSERPLSRQSTPTSLPGVNSCLAASQLTSASPVTTHPSYLDFIYGANGLMAQMAAKSKKMTPLKNKSTLIQPVQCKKGKRKRGDDGVSTHEEASAQQFFKKMRIDSTTHKDVSTSNAHTIHYMPTTSSLICDKSSLRESPAVWLSQSHNLWSAPTVDGFNRLIPTTNNPSRKLGQRQS